MATPVETVEEWFAAHAREDLAAARALVADDLVLRVASPPSLAGEFHGFDAFMDWYATRRDAFGPTTYRVADVLGSEQRAAAVLVIGNGTIEWEQVAVYTVTDGHIERIHVYEDAPASD